MTAAAIHPAGLPQPRRTVAITAVLSAMSLVVLDAGMVNVALPSMAEALGASAAHAVLVVTAYQTALVMALLPCGALGERFGHRRVFQAGVAVFVAGSVLCALSPSLPWLVAARFLQGLGGAAVMALGVALLRFAVAPGRLGAAVGWNALTVALSAAAAPMLGALVISRFDWPWLFLAGLPAALTSLVAARALPDPPGASTPLDLASMALNGAAFAGLVGAVESLLGSPPVALLAFALAMASMAALLRREAPKPAPLFPLDLLGDRSFRLSVIASICCFTGQAAGLVALPFHLQHELGHSPLMTALHLSPWPLGVAITSLVAGRLSDRLPTAWLCAAGAGLLALGMATIALRPPGAVAQLLPIAVAICGVGFGLFQVPNNRTLFLAAPPQRSGAAGGMQGTARLTGQVAGAVLMTLLFTLTSLAAAPRIGLAAAAGFALASGLVSLQRASARSLSIHVA